MTNALNFDTPDCHVTGSCDLYTTKAAGSDKKLYKNIDKSLESQQASLQRLGASLSPPERSRMAETMNISQSSPFGNLAEMSSRRTYAYLIATLNASHPDYEFSHTLRPSDFKREKDLKSAISIIDSTLTNVRAPTLNGSIPRSYSGSGVYGNTGTISGSGHLFPSSMATSSMLLDEEGTPTWGPHMWAKIDKEMELSNCQIYSYQPAEDPFEEDEPAVWSFNYFFFNKALKRVVYLYSRAVPVLSHSPNLRPRIRRGSSSLAGPSTFGFHRSEADDYHGSFGSAKRARFWLGDRVTASEITEDDDDSDGLVWNRDKDGEVENPNEYPSDDYEYQDSDDGDTISNEDDDQQMRDRGYSEDIAGKMELD